MRLRLNVGEFSVFGLLVCFAAFVLSLSIARANNLTTELTSNNDVSVSAYQVGTGQLSVFHAVEADDLILIDRDIPDMQNLIRQWRNLPNTHVRIIESGSNGLEEISKLVSKYSNLKAIHLITHGREGAIVLGGRNYGAAAIAHEDEMLFNIAHALAKDGELFFYGCEIGRGEAGRKFVTKISEAIQHSVAASSNRTGSNRLGGDWVLEQVTTKLKYASLRSANWNHLLSQNTTGAWTLGTNSASNTITVGSNSTVATVSFSGFTTATTVTSPLTAQSFNNLAVFNPAVQNLFSLGVEYDWDTVPEAGTVLASTDSGNATMTINFSRPVKDPIIHLDRLGGSDGTLQNGMAFTLQTSGITLAKLSGTSHFSVVGNVITNGQIGQPIAVGYSAESSTTTNLGTAAGSVVLTGVFSTVTFLLSPGTNSTEGAGGDAFEVGFTYDPIPAPLPDNFNNYVNANLSGNLYANNGSGLDSDFNNDAMTLTLINGSAFTVGAAIPLLNGSLTITNASTGAFNFVPNSGFTGTQSFTYSLRDNNFGTASSIATINVMQTTLTIQTVSLGGINGFSYSGNNGWTLQTNNTVSPNVGVSSPTEILTVPNTATSITQTLPVGYVLTSIVCSGLGGGVATPNLGTRTIALDAIATAMGNSVVCIFTNLKTPTFKLQKKTVGGFGGPFNFSQTNLSSTPPAISTTSINTLSPVTAATINVSSLGSTISITELPSTGYVLNGISCIDNNSGFTGNVGSFAILSGSTMTIPAANVVAGAEFQCELTNALKPTVKVQLSTTVGFGGPFTFTQVNLASNPPNISTTAVNTVQPASPTAIAVVSLNSVVQISETPWSGYAITSVDCTDANAAVTGNTGSFGNVVGNTLTISSARVKAGANITCIFRNVIPSPQLAIIKTANTSGPVQLGQVISYTYTVTNTGNVSFANVFVGDVHNGYGVHPLPLNETLTTDVVPIGDSLDAVSDGHWDTLGPGDTLTFMSSYVVVQADVDLLQ
jgi:Domain of unknown function (DUF4347)/Bacterial Ig domain